LNKPSVQHLSEGRNAWRLGAIGFFTRLKGIALTALLTLITMGAPWWIPENYKISGQVTIKYQDLIIGSLIVLSGFFTFSFYYLRKRSIRSLDTKYYLHQLSHDIRDKQTDLHEKLFDDKKYSLGKLHKDLEILLSEVSENISSHFKLITGDSTVCVAIRLARYEKSDRQIYYRTYARSKGFNPQRKKNSQDIPANKGIPRFLKEDNDGQGVLIYNNLKAAKENGTYFFTKNDEKFPDDVKTMMVAPLNAWSGRRESMIGLLYITSRDAGVFKPIHVDAMAFAADLTASAVANSFEIVKEKVRNGDSRSDYAKAI
jgi:hypothetical protein|tara:strand:- start:307 stop:1251 length:945 start_codon:yes stop_codon:yes gene_type:complete